MKKKQTNKLIYILPVLALVGYFAGQTIKKQFLSSEEAKIEEEVFPIVRENISDDMKLVIEPDHIEIVEGTIVVYLKQDTNAPSSPTATNSRDFIKGYLNSKLESWKETSAYQDKEIQVMFNDEAPEEEN